MPYCNCAIRVQKRAIRQSMLRYRRQLPAAVVQTCSQRIIDQLINIDMSWVNARVHMYCANPQLGEVNATPFICLLRAHYPHAHVDVVPYMPSPPMPKGTYDVIIVPIVAFDDRLYRIGMGAGWYDRFLAAQPQAYTIGLAYEGTRVQCLPHDTYDISLNAVITEQRIYKASKHLRPDTSPIFS